MGDAVERVREIIVQHLRVDEGKVTENASFRDDLGADSLATVELLMAFEDEFGCKITNDAAEKMVSMQAVLSFVTGARAGEVSVANRSGEPAQTAG